jgi:hypothetical protein
VRLAVDGDVPCKLPWVSVSGRDEPASHDVSSVEAPRWIKANPTSMRPNFYGMQMRNSDVASVDANDRLIRPRPG